MRVSPVTLAIARDFRDRLAAELPAGEVRLFGPCLRGDDEADLDLCVIFAESPTADQLERIYAIAWSTGFDHGATLCPLVLSLGELLEHDSPLVATIRSEGQVV